MAVAIPAAAHAQAPQSPDPAIMATGDGKYGFSNLKSAKLLAVAGGSTANGARIVQNPLALSGGDLISDQNWAASDAGGGYYSFRNVRSGKALGVDGASTAAGAGLIQATPDTSNNQDWRFETSATYPAGVYRIRNRKSNLCIGIPGASTATGVQAAQFPCDGTQNQGWKLVDN
jgi:hypothetical protein